MSEPKLPLDIDHSCWRTTPMVLRKSVAPDGSDGMSVEPIDDLATERRCPVCQYERGWRDAAAAVATVAAVERVG